MPEEEQFGVDDGAGNAKTVPLENKSPANAEESSHAGVEATDIDQNDAKPTQTIDGSSVVKAVVNEEAGKEPISLAPASTGDGAGAGGCAGTKKSTLVEGFRKRAGTASAKLKEHKVTLKERGKEKAETASAKLKERAENLKELTKERRIRTTSASSASPKEACSKPITNSSVSTEESEGDGRSENFATVPPPSTHKEKAEHISLKPKGENEIIEKKKVGNEHGCSSLITTPGPCFVQAAEIAAASPSRVAETLAAAQKEAAQKAGEATKKAAEEARRKAEATASRVKAAFQKGAETGFSDGLRPKLLLNKRIINARDVDPGIETKRGLMPSSGKADGDGVRTGSSPSAQEVAERTRGVLKAQVKAGAAAVKIIERKLYTVVSKESSDNGPNSSGTTSEKDAIAEKVERPDRPREVGPNPLLDGNVKEALSECGSNEATNPRSKNVSKEQLVVGPILEIAVRDSTILLSMSAIVARWTYKSIPMIVEHGAIPLSTAFSWSVMGFLAGFHWSYLSTRVPLLARLSAGIGLPSFSSSSTVPTPPRASPVVGRDADEADERHRLFRHALRRVSGIRRIRYVDIDGRMSSASAAAAAAPSASATSFGPDGFWTCLQERDGSRAISSWAMNVGQCSENDVLLKRLLAFGDFRLKERDSEWSGGRMRVSASVCTTGEGDCARANGNVSADDNQNGIVQQVGAIRLRNKKMVETLAGKFVVDPLCRLRGVDVFQTDCPEEKIYMHRLLTKMGLRKVPTFIINVMAPWANLVFYFQMPDWVKKFEDIKEAENDSEDTKTLKRFLTGSDEYRNARLKLLPSLVDGPLPIRLMAPPKKELTIPCDVVPITWHFCDETTSTENGSAREAAALVEADLDFVMHPKIRKTASIVHPYTARVTLDCVFVITRPRDSGLDEPSACLGMCRLDKIDLAGCAKLPPKTEAELMREASVIMGDTAPAAAAEEEELLSPLQETTVVAG